MPEDAGLSRAAPDEAVIALEDAPKCEQDVEAG